MITMQNCIISINLWLFRLNAFTSSFSFSESDFCIRKDKNKEITSEMSSHRKRGNAEKEENKGKKREKANQKHMNWIYAMFHVYDEH